MSCALGIDVGSTTAKVAVLSDGGVLLHSACVRHAGRPAEVLDTLLAEVRARYDVARSCVTGSIGLAFASALSATTLHETHAVTLAADALHPGFRSIVELGGQDAKIIVRAADGGRLDAQMNDRCAAGTGATIDRIARRLGVFPRELSALTLSGDLRVASKCGVFAETDIVNLMHRGATAAQALSALARAIVVQNLSVLARGRVLAPPVLLLGGPHAHLPMLVEAFRQELSALWSARQVAFGPIEAPAAGDLYVAIGAAHHALVGGQSQAVARTTAAGSRDEGPLLGAAGATDVADEDRRALSALRCEPDAVRLPAGACEVHLGLDAGSTTVKAVLLDSTGQLLASSYATTTGDPLEDARARLRELWRIASEHACELGVRSFGITGYGAELLAPLLGADLAPVETVAHARAAAALDPDVEVVVDVGGTDIKVLCMRDGEVTDFFVSNQCSAGHGAFLAATAADLGVPVDEIAERALGARRAPRFCVGCAVFMDSDRVAFQRDGYAADELLAGLARTVARNVWEFVVPHAPAQLGRRFVLTGGTQRNLAVAWAQRAYLRERVPAAQVLVHPHPELCGAIGAALLAREQVSAARGPASFRGLSHLASLSMQSRTGESLRCHGCELSCARTEVTVDGGGCAPRTWLVGNTCERGADPKWTARRGRGHAVDLFADEATSLFRWPSQPSPPRLSAKAARPPVIGIPRVMCMYRAAPLLLAYLQAAGVPRHNVVWSPVTTAAMFQQGARRGNNDPCFPAKLMHAHVDWLLSRKEQLGLQLLLMPAITHAAVVTSGTADHAACPIVTACGYTALAALRAEPAALGDVVPVLGDLDLSDTMRLRTQVRVLFHPWLSLSDDDHTLAFDHALSVARQRALRRRARGARVIAAAAAEGRAVVVVLGRPYHADPGVSHGVSTELAARGIPVLGLTALPIGSAELCDLRAVAPETTNSGSGEKLWAARVIAALPNLLAVDVSSFRCGQDASVLGELTQRLAQAKKPALYLHDLDEDRPSVSFRLRIETFVSALQRYERSVLRRHEHDPRATEATAWSAT